MMHIKNAMKNVENLVGHIGILFAIKAFLPEPRSGYSVMCTILHGAPKSLMGFLTIAASKFEDFHHLLLI